jgi:hypothetical protein
MVTTVSPTRAGMRRRRRRQVSMLMARATELLPAYGSRRAFWLAAILWLAAAMFVLTLLDVMRW